MNKGKGKSNTSVFDKLEVKILNLDMETEGAKAVSRDAAAAMDELLEICKGDLMPVLTMLEKAEKASQLEKELYGECNPVERFDELNDAWRPLIEGGKTYDVLIVLSKQLMTDICRAVYLNGDREAFAEYLSKTRRHIEMTYKKPRNAM